MNIATQMVVEVLKFKKSCNLIGGDHFRLQLKIFLRLTTQFTMSHLWGIIHSKKKNNAALIKIPNIPLFVQICFVHLMSRQQI